MGHPFSKSRSKSRPRTTINKPTAAAPAEPEVKIPKGKEREELVDVVAPVTSPNPPADPISTEQKRKEKRKKKRASNNASGSGRRSSSYIAPKQDGSIDTPEVLLAGGSGREVQPSHRSTTSMKDSNTIDVLIAGDDNDYDDADDDHNQDDVSGNDFVGDGSFEFGDQEDSSGHEKVKCLANEKEILLEQERSTREIAEVLSIPGPTASSLLRHFKWNKDKLLHRYMEDPLKCCTEAGLVAPPKTGASSAHSTGVTGSLSADQICLICAESIPAARCSSLACHHVFCTDCWDSYLSMKIQEGETAMTCPAVKCPLIVDEATVRRLVSPAVYEKYVRFVTKAYVETNPAVRWCPSPGCGNAINALDVVKGAVTCACGFRFCFSCNREAHAPATCEQLTLWLRKCKDDSETTHWIYANTQDCPKCKSPIEKNGGCNHLTCRQCHYEFCWMCQRDWKGHNDFYQCNKFKKDADKKPTSGSNKKKESQKEKEAREKEASRVALEKYLHYYHRYQNHDKSREFERKLREEANARMRELTQSDTTWLGVQYISKAAEQLILCRSMLKYSYVYGYYLPEEGTAAKHLFEYLQQDLELTTEELSGALLTPAEKIDRAKVVKLTTLAERRYNALGDAVENGLSSSAASPLPLSANSGSDNSLERLIVAADAGSSGSSRTRRQQQQQPSVSATSSSSSVVQLVSATRVTNSSSVPLVSSPLARSVAVSAPSPAPSQSRVIVLSVRTPTANNNRNGAN